MEQDNSTEQTAIDDFGDKIEGARKDAYQNWTQAIATGSLSDFRALPLSKSWPEPNYKTLPVPDSVKAFVRASRDVLGRKPGRSKVTEWSLRAQAFLNTTKAVLENDWDEDVDLESVLDFASDEFDEQLEETKEKVGIFFTHRSAEYANKIVQDIINRLKNNFNKIEPCAIAYEHLGMDVSLKGFQSLVRPAGNTNEYCVQVVANQSSHSKIHIADNWDKAIKQLVEDPFFSKDKKANKARRYSNFKIIRYRNNPNIYIALKHNSEWMHFEKFDSPEEARAALNNSESIDRWQDTYDKWRKQVPTRSRQNTDRVGIHWREGEDVSPELFAETFGFRGVQFGNYVGNERRQEDLNNAYDALMDLAYVLDLEPRSLSLDSSLGLAFGARGKGGIRAASAHYEPLHRVINLTKNKGAGSLAHEWFHALDNYLHTTLISDENKGKRFDYITNQLFRLKTQEPEDRNIVEATNSFSSIVERLRQRSLEFDRKSTGKRYWSTTIEIGARAFEAAVKEKLKQWGYQNDYLVNIVSEQAWDEYDKLAFDGDFSDNKPSYPYPTKSESADNMDDMMSFFENMRHTVPVLQERFGDTVISDKVRETF